MTLRYLLVLFMAAAVCGCDYGPPCNITNGQAPELLSATGCIDMDDPAQPAAGAIPYDINEPFWSDGAQKYRYMALPRNAEIDIGTDGDFQFPVGTALIKNFSLNGKFFETRLFVRSSDTAWNGYSYKWNDTRTEAQLLKSAAEVAIDQQIWHFPSSEECFKCHTAAAGFSLGLEIAQLNKDYSYTSARKSINQIDYLQSLGVLADIPPEARQLKLATSKNPAHNLADRARAYLHSNCSQCHRPGAGTESTLDLRVGAALADMNACNTRPLLGDFGIVEASLLAPGDHARSILWSRMHTQDNNRMPPWFSKVIDTDGVRLIQQWIDSLTGCG